MLSKMANSCPNHMKVCVAVTLNRLQLQPVPTGLFVVAGEGAKRKDQDQSLLKSAATRTNGPVFFSPGLVWSSLFPVEITRLMR